MYSILRILLFTVFYSTPFSVYFGRKPVNLVLDLTLPSGIVSSQETEDLLDAVLEC